MRSVFFLNLNDLKCPLASPPRRLDPELVDGEEGGAQAESEVAADARHEVDVGEDELLPGDLHARLDREQGDGHIGCAVDREQVGVFSLPQLNYCTRKCLNIACKDNHRPIKISQVNKLNP